MLRCDCSVIDRRGRQNVARTLMTHSAIVSCATFYSYYNLSSSMINQTYQSLNKHMATWNLFVKMTKKIVCVNNEATLLITFRFFCMIIMMSTVLGESPFMLSSLGHLKDPKNILIIFTRRTVLKRMCPRPIWFTYVGFNVANEYKQKKNGYGYTKASLTSD